MSVFASSTLQSELAQRIINLEASLAREKTLQGLLPICSYCKKVRNDGDYWQQVELYIEEHADALFSHGICPTCCQGCRRTRVGRIREQGRQRRQNL